MNTNEKKPILGTRLLYIIFSIIIAIALWSYVAYVENPDVSIPVSNIPITFNGADILEDNSLIVTDISAEHLSFRLTGKRNNVTKANNDNVAVTVNLGSIISEHGASPGTYQLTYEIDYPDNVNGNALTVSSESTKFISVHVERLMTTTIPISGTYNGNISEGFMASPMTFDVGEIGISGPEEIVNAIDHAWVELNINYDINKTIEQETSFQLLDRVGRVIESEFLTMSRDTVIATIPVLAKKEVALTVNFADTSSTVKENYTLSINPPTITISGESDELEDINKIVLGTIDLNSFANSITQTMPIVLADGINNLTGQNTAEVTVTVLGLDTKSFVCNNIVTKNTPEGMNKTVTTQSVNVLLRGRSEDLELIDPSNITIVANLSELSKNTGTYTVEAKVQVDGFTNVDAIGEYSITVILTN